MGIYIFNHDDTRLAGAAPIITRTAWTHAEFPGAVSVSDIDNDERVELLAGISGHAFVFEFAGHPNAIQWARYRANNGNTGAYPIDDCNNNRIADELDLVRAVSRDCNTNQIPDECERPGDADSDGDTDLVDHASFVRVSSDFGPLNNSVPAAPKRLS